MALRMFAHEDAWLREQAAIAAADAGVRVTRADVARAVLFGVPAGVGRPAQPCSSAHPDCTAHHASLVTGFRLMHHAEELQVEDLTAAHSGDTRIWRENGGRFTTFGEWLKSNGGDHAGRS